VRSDSDAGGELSRTRRARRDDITAAAIEVLDREGFAAATLDRIAAVAGTGKGVVLYHFGSKEAVFEAVVGDLFSRGAAIMTERILAETGWRARLHAYIDSNLRFIADNAAHVAAVHRILENAPTSVDQDSVAALRDLLAKGQDAGELGDFDPQVIALMIRAVVDAASFYFTENPGIDIDHHIAQAVRAFDRATAL
jgi:AcrR family transcriptional regulator